EGRVVGPIRAIPARAREPATGELVVEGDVGPEGRRRAVFLPPPAPDELRAREEALVDGAAERAVAQGRVEPEQVRRESTGIEPGLRSLGRPVVVAGRDRPAH